VTAATDTASTEFRLRQYLKRATEDVVRLRQRVRGLDAARSEPVAILGMACRLPGGVSTPDEFWRLLADGRDAVGPPPTDRDWTGAPVTAGGFLADAGGFDAGFFGISPREALAMDPQQRVLLELAWEALERARISPQAVRGTPVGVFVGAGAQGYGETARAATTDLGGHLLTGAAPSILSGRLAYTLGLTGPAVTVDTACSSSLVALHQAVAALRSGECGLALTAGVTVMAVPDVFTEFARQGGLAPDGRCRSYADGAAGTGWAEGAGVLVLARLSEARRHGHPVLALVRGSAVNSDGASNGLTAPNGLAQQRVIRDALASAGLQPSDVDMVEGHGTGTVLGDPIEAQALLATYGVGRDRALWLGSVKSNLGHTQAAAGITGVIKTVLAMRHAIMPPTLHADARSSRVDWSTGDVRLLNGARTWLSAGRPRRAGVSAFGMSGTNAHVVLEEATDEPVETGPDPDPDCPVPWPVSARSFDALDAQLDRITPLVGHGPARDIGHSLATTRAALEHRAVLLSTGERIARGVAVADPSVVFVFPGQGGQWAGMGLELAAAEKEFGERLDHCAEALRRHVDWSLREVLADPAALTRVDVVQPALWAVMVSLAGLWRACGVEPAAVVGHSQGEVAAACVAGALDLADGARIAVLRSRVIAARLAGAGAMASLPLDLDAVCTRLAGYSDVSIAAVNGPASVVVSGPGDAVRALVGDLNEAGVRARTVDVDYASHSAQVESLRAELDEALTGLRPSSVAIPMCSSVTGEFVSGTELDVGYWYRNLRETVRFTDAITTLADRGHTAFVEIGPHPMLAPAVADTLDAVAGGAVAIGTLRRNDGGAGRFLQAVAEVHVHGVAVDWRRWHRGGRTVDLPTYPFQHTRFWPARRAGGGPGLLGHPILHTAIDLADGAVLLTGELSLTSHPWLADHVLGGHPILPGAAFAELVLAAGERAGASGIDELTLERPLVVPGDGAVTLQLRIEPPDDGGARALTIHGRSFDGPWTRHATATLTPEPPGDPAPVRPWTGGDAADLAGFYAGLAGHGFGYGPAFQGLRAAWREDNEVRAEVELPADELDTAGMLLHPALLDAALHAAVFARLGAAPHGRIPFCWRGVRVHGTGTRAARVRMCRTGPDTVSLRLDTDDRTPLLTVDELTLRPVTDRLAADVSAAADAPLLRIAWRTVDLPADVSAADVPVITVRPAQPGPAGVHDTVITLLDDVRAAIEADRPCVVRTRNATHDPAAAAAWGLVRSAQTEHPGLFTLLDSATDPSPELLARVLTATEPQLAIDGTTVTAPRLVPADPPDRAQLGWNPDGTVLITGGTSGLGALMARHLVTAHGMRRLLLVSRRGPDAPRVAELTGELRALGAEVGVAACDVADSDRLAELVSTVEHPLTAVVHAAGVLEDGLLGSLTPERVRAVLRPKVDAAWHLHELAGDVAGFVLFSSISGVSGAAGQAAYAAANAALDALVRYRHARGLPGVSLAWGAWRQATGMTTGLDHDRLARGGFPALDNETGLRMFDRALRGDQACAVPVRLDRAVLRQREDLPPMLAELVPARPRRRDRGGTRQRILALTGAEREAALTDLVLAETAAVLGHDDPAALEPGRTFTELGLDSLTSLELRNRLASVLGVRLPATAVFQYPGPAGFAGRIATVLAEEPPAMAPPADDPVVALYGEFVAAGLRNDGTALLRGLARLRPLFADSGTVRVGEPARLTTTGDGAHLVAVGPAVPLTGAHVFQRFAGAFSGRRPVSALTPPGFTEDEPLPATSEALVGLQVRQVLDTVGDGPFALLGVSSGGILAHAAGRALAARGRPPCGVVLLDTYTMTDPRLDAFDTHLLEAMRQRQGVVTLDRTRLTAFVWTCNLFHDWVPAEAGFPTLLVRATESLRPDGPGPDWQTTLPAMTAVVDVPGDHFTMLERHVVTTAEAVENWLTDQEEKK
jgi:acyl transferase domain-containing protein/acyl carrier protein